MTLASFLAGHSGVAHTMDGPDWLSDFALQPDGKFLASGTAIFGFNADGTRDNLSQYLIQPALDELSVQVDGKIIALHRNMGPDNGAGTFHIYRLLPDGRTDTTFGNGTGKVPLPLPANSDVLELLVQKDGKILLGSWDRDVLLSGEATEGWHLMLARLLPDGMPDTSFGQNGIVRSPALATRPSAIYQQSDGKILIACSSPGVYGDSSITVYRYKQDGSLDASYGNGGKSSMSFGDDAVASWVSSITMQPDGKLLIATHVLTGDVTVPSKIGVARLDAEGKVDQSFGIGGKASYYIAADHNTWLPGGNQFGTNEPYGLILQQNGRILVGFNSGRIGPSGGDEQTGVIALSSDGSIDTSWGSEGLWMIGEANDSGWKGEQMLEGPHHTLLIRGYHSPNDGTIGYHVAYGLNADGSINGHFGAMASAPTNSIDYVSRHAPKALNAAIELSAEALGGVLLVERHGGANTSDKFTANATVDGVNIGELAISGGALRMSFNAAATPAMVNKFLQSISYGNDSDIAAPQVLVIDWTYNNGSQNATFATTVDLTPGEQPHWIDQLLAHTAAGQSNAQLKDVLARLVGADKIIDVSYVSDAGAAPVDMAKVRTLVNQLTTIIDLRIGADKASDSDSLTLHNASEMAAGTTAYSGPSKAGANIYFKPGAGGVDALMDDIQARLTEALGLRHDDAPLNPMGQLETAALQYLYGPSTTIRTGNDTYALSTTAANFLWDGLGQDTISAAGLNADVTLHLEPGHWDYIGARGNSITAAGQITVNYGSTFENAIGGNGNDQLNGTRQANHLQGGAGNDTLSGLGGGDILDGGSGTDTAIYAGKRSAYAITNVGGAFNISDASGKDALIGIERLHFADADLALDINGNAGQLFRLYQAIFNRKPDLAGLGWWLDAVDRGVGMESVAETFTHSVEFTAMYGANASNSVLLTKIYQYALHRSPDKDGFDWWLDVLENHKASLGSVLMGFSESTENYTQVIGSIQDGIAFTPWHG
jgi:uncharacterized delta-60 repeat protein